ncbi:MAG: glycosyltransferase family 4 protein [Cytophagales bacterium]
MKISKNISEQVLTVGLQYVDHRGGIGGVIDTYHYNFESFKFVATYKPQKNKLAILPYFLQACFSLIKQLLTDKKIKIVHIHGAAKGSLVRKYIMFFIAKFIFRKTVIYHSHGSELKMFYDKSPNILKSWLKHFFNNVDVIICLSVQWEKFFNDNFSPKKIIILENIVDQQPSNSLKPKSDTLPLKILFLGAIGNRKGIFDLLETLKTHKNAWENNLKLTIGGNGEVEKLEKFITENQLEKMVSFAGWVTGNKKLELLNTHDIYVLPSYNEGLPLSILEAMSFGMPVISTNVGGIPEVVKTNRNGVLIHPGNTGEIALAIQMYLDDMHLIKTHGEQSLNIVEPFYSQNVIKKLNSIYKDILNH